MPCELNQNGQYLNLDLNKADQGDCIDFTLKFDTPKMGKMSKEIKGEKKEWTWRMFRVKLHSLNGQIIDKECSFFAKYRSSLMGKDFGEYLADFKAGNRFKATMIFKKGARGILQVWDVEQLAGGQCSQAASPCNNAPASPPPDEQAIIAKLIELSTNQMTGETRKATYEQVAATLKVQADIKDEFILKKLYDLYIAAMG
jgi:hypothetical protein